LNIFDEYPFWFTLFTELGVRVVISSPSTSKMYRGLPILLMIFIICYKLDGADTIPSDTMCYPAKLIHGHILDLINKFKVKRIFYPSVLFTLSNDKNASNSAHCPIVSFIFCSNFNNFFLIFFFLKVCIQKY
jgi:predicted nucleotide-binding protein (sugar kinase/HSP70/actin superfamily)